MGFESFIARRYLVSRHKINFITIISFISIIGITIGVAALIVVLSVFNGFGNLVSQYLMNLDPHLRITALSETGEKQLDTIPELLRKSKEVKFISPFVDGKVLAYNKGLTQVVTLKGIKQASTDDLYMIDKSIVYGTSKFLSGVNNSGVLLGIQLADRLQVIAGDTLLLISPVGIEKAITQFSLPVSRRVIVTGIYSSNNNDYDAGYIFSSLENAQYLLGYKKTVQGYEARLTDIFKSFSVKKSLEEILVKKDFSVSTWYDFHQELYSVMQIERWTAYVILSLIIAVATFNILGSLSMSVIEKRRDIGILRSMGVKEKSILKIFMFEGLLIGIIGTVIGVLLGYLICYLQIQYNIYPLNPAQYKIDSLPVEIRLSDFFYISGASMFLAFLASLYPAKKAAKVNPIAAIKWE